MADLPIIKFTSDLAAHHKIKNHVGLTYWDGERSTTPAVVEILCDNSAHVLSCQPGFRGSAVLFEGRLRVERT